MQASKWKADAVKLRLAGEVLCFNMVPRLCWFWFSYMYNTHISSWEDGYILAIYKSLNCNSNGAVYDYLISYSNISVNYEYISEV